MNRIETYLLGGNQAHDLVGFEENTGDLKIWFAPCGALEDKEKTKGYHFQKYERKYKEVLLEPDEALELYLPFIGGNSYKDKENDREFFCLNFGDIEIGFWSEWPERIELEPVDCLNSDQLRRSS